VVVEAVCWSSNLYRRCRAHLAFVESISWFSNVYPGRGSSIAVMEHLSPLSDLYRRCRTRIVVAECLALSPNHLPSLHRPGVRKSQRVGREKQEGKMKMNHDLYRGLFSSRTSALLILVVVNFHLPPSFSRIFESMSQSSRLSLRWVGFAIVGFVLPRLGWIHGRWLRSLSSTNCFVRLDMVGCVVVASSLFLLFIVLISSLPIVSSPSSSSLVLLPSRRVPPPYNSRAALHFLIHQRMHVPRGGRRSCAEDLL